MVENTCMLAKIRIFVSAVTQEAIELGTVFHLLNELGIIAFVVS